MTLVPRCGETWRCASSGAAPNWANPNLSRLERHATNGSTVVVPGKLLGTGEITGVLTVAAYSVSARARTKVEAAGGRVITYSELIDENPKGSGVLLLG